VLADSADGDFWRGGGAFWHGDRSPAAGLPVDGADEAFGRVFSTF
jgi:hypothetical protein